VAFFERYATNADVPVRTGTEVTAVRVVDHGFELDTSDGSVRTRVLAAATGAFQRPLRPEGLAGLPADVDVLDAKGYTSPEALPDGGVLIVGSGQTGVQLAEEVHGSGRDVVLACGRAPWMSRRIGDHDLVWWLLNSGYLDVMASELPPAMRLLSNPLTTGHGGGHDLHYRTLQRAGVTLTGRFARVDGAQVLFDDDLAACVAFGDARREDLAAWFMRWAREQGHDVVDLEAPEPFVCDPPTSLPVSRFSSVIVTGGFRPDYRSWMPWADAFDPLGFPLQTDGQSDVVDGLFFTGVHFLRKRKSGILLGAREDAGVVADRIADRLGAAPAG
jgi:putative flavoprotein involved in K+ transport